MAMLKADLEAAKAASEQHDKDQFIGLPTDDGVAADVIEAPGIIRDLYSDKTWTLPTDSLQDGGLATYKSPRDFKKDPSFHYQIVRYAGVEPELDEYLSRDYVPVTRKELGLADYKNPGQPNPLDSFYTIGGTDIVVKIPRELAEREYAANKSLCDSALDGVKRKGTYITRDKDGNVIADRPPIDKGGEPIERILKGRSNRHEPTRDELA